jgi:hypothetical protein
MDLENGLGKLTRGEERDNVTTFHVEGADKKKFTIYVRHDGHILMKAGGVRLQERTELFNAVTAAVKLELGEQLIEGDPYGDVALSRGLHKLSSEQNRARAALYRRQNDLGRNPKVDKAAFLAVLADYYNGAYAPNPCETLSAQFDMLEPEKEDFSDLL